MPVVPASFRNPFGRRGPLAGLAAPVRLAVLCLAGQLLAAVPSSSQVDFPGPLLSPLPEPGLSVLSARLPGETTEAMLVGMADGTLGLISYTAITGSFQLRQRLTVGGRVVGLMRWNGLPLLEAGVVAATADPDRVVFVKLGASFPYLRQVAAVDIEEDPGSLAWFGDLNSGQGEVAVTLPGVDAVTFLHDDGGWRVRQTLAVGDEPWSLTGADLDGDGVREVVAAERGVLSGDLAVISLAAGGRAEARIVRVPGLTAGLVASYDDDGDGVDELAVTDRDLPRVAFLKTQGSGFAAIGELQLSLPAGGLTMWTLPDGAPALMAGNADRGASGFGSRGEGGWVRHDTYYPGCRPQAMAAADFDGDGLTDIATVGAGAQVLALMLARPGPGFRGLPALALTALPGDFVRGDFDGDGRPDILVAAAIEARLSLFAGKPEGGLETTARELQLGFVPGELVAIEVDGDPMPELAVLDVGAGQVVILEVGAGGVFTELDRKQVGSFPTFLTAGDIDADGLVDLLALPADGSRVQLLFGQGSGALGDAVTLTYVIGTTRAALVDLNGDGRQDVVGIDGISRLWWRLNLGGRTFGPGQWLNAGQGAAALAAGDLDGDLDLDLVVACRVDQSLVSFENLGNGNLVRRSGSYVLDSEPAGVRVGDFDRDGRGDVVVNLRDADRLDIYLSIIPWNHLFAMSVSATPDVLDFGVTDFNGDGHDDLLSLDNTLRMGVAHLNLDPAGVALEPRSLTVECLADGGLEARLEPGLDGPWRLEARQGQAWSRLADAAGAAIGTLAAEAGVWRLSVSAAELEGWGPITALRLEVARPDGSAESREAAVDAPCAAAPVRGGPVWLAGPWPNPGNPRIKVRFRLPSSGPVRVVVHDLQGRRVAVLAEGDLAVGDHELSWDGAGPGGPAAAGTYLLRVETRHGHLDRKLVLLK